MWLYTRATKETRKKGILLPIMARHARDAFRVSKRPRSEKRVCLWKLTNTRLGYPFLQTCFPDLSRVCRGFCATSNDSCGIPNFGNVP